MKIDSGVKSVGTTVAANRPAAANPVPRQADAGAAAHVAISSLSARMAEVGSAESAPVNSARVAEIKQAIAEGRFTINPERIADGLLDSVRDMLGQRRQG